MPGRNPNEAWRAFKEPIERAVGAIDQAIRLVTKVHTVSDGELRILKTEEPGLSFGPAHLLSIALHVVPIEQDDRQWRMTTRKYDYTLTERARPNKVVIGWHWHPRSRRSGVSNPHMHIPTANAFPTKHLPTGRVALEDVLLFGLDELGVTPAVAGAREIVDRVRTNFVDHRSWA